MKKIKATHFVDGGHSWLSVKRSMLVDLGIAEKITGCSYQKGDSVYLEEDCDMSTFFKAFTQKMKDNGTFIDDKLDSYFDIKNSYSDSSPVRNYASYTPNKAEMIVGEKVRIYGKMYEIVEQMKVKSLEDGTVYTLKKKHLDDMVKVI